jgi:hypothetical protein
MFLRKREFGFMCPAFSLGLTGDGFLLPKSHKQLLNRSLLAMTATRDITGRYTLQVHHNGARLCKVPVVVAWARHKSQTESFLALKVSQPRKLGRHLKPVSGKDVELSFTPRLAPDVIRPAPWFGNADITA